MTHKEDIVQFPSTVPLSGVWCRPENAAIHRFNLVLVNSGIVHRIGANRVSVQLARQAAFCGIGSLRFDISGIGESTARAGEVPWEQASVEDISAAVAHLKTGQPDLPVGLFGNCGGAAKSFWTALARPDVTALFLTNPPPLNGYAPGKATPPPSLDALIAHFRQLIDRECAIRIAFAKGDIGEQFFNDFLREPLQAYQTAGALQVMQIAHSNHTFAPVRARRQMIEKMLFWIRDLAAQDRGFLRLEK